MLVNAAKLSWIQRDAQGAEAVIQNRSVALS